MSNEKVEGFFIDINGLGLAAESKQRVLQGFKSLVVQEFARHDEGFEGALIFQNRLEHSKRPSRIEVAGGIRVRDLKVLQEKGLQAVRDSVVEDIENRLVGK